MQTTRPHVRGKFLWVGDEKLYIKGVTYGTFRPDVDGVDFPPPDRVEEVPAAEFPKEAVLQARIGETNAALGNREAALAAYRKALELAPLNPEAMEMVRRLATQPKNPS